VAFRDVTPERKRRPQSVLIVNWRKIAITLIEGFSEMSGLLRFAANVTRVQLERERN
jgi:hypothetical protein